MVNIAAWRAGEKDLRPTLFLISKPRKINQCKMHHSFLKLRCQSLGQSRVIKMASDRDRKNAASSGKESITETKNHKGLHEHSAGSVSRYIQLNLYNPTDIS